MPETDQVKIGAEKIRNPKTDQEIVGALTHDVTSSEAILSPMHRSWYEAILWTAGEQNMEWNPRTRRFQPRVSPLSVPRAISNLILGRVERGVSMFLKALPTVHYSPTSADASDREKAENATGAIRYDDRVSRMEAKKRDLGNWVVVTGTGFAMAIEDKVNAKRVTVPVMAQVPETDPETGQPMTDPMTGEPVMTEREMPGADGKPDAQIIVMADQGIEICAPFEIIPHWNARYPWEWRRYTHVRARTRDWVGRVFGSKSRASVKPESPAGFIGTMASYQTKVIDILTRAALAGSYGLPYGFGGSVTEMRAMEDSGVVMTRYQLPDEDHPEGRMLVVCGGDVLHDGEYPYGDRLNLFTFRWHVLPGSPAFGFGMPRNLMSLQKRRNGIDTQTDMIRKSMGSPRILADRKSQVSLDTQTSEMGHIITYKATPGIGEPRVLPAASGDGDARYQRAEINTDADDVAGTQDVLRGVNPTGVTAGVTIQHLTEQASERFRPMVDENREEFLRLYDMRIEIAKASNAWQRPRTVKMVGQSGRIGQKQLTAADITGEFSAEAEDSAAATMSHALKRAGAMELVDKGAIDLSSEKNRDRLRRLYGAAEFSEDVDLDRKRAEDENERMYQGEPVRRQPIDDDPTHADTHTEEMKTDRFEQQPQEIQEAFYAHLKEHVDNIQASAQLAAAAAPVPGQEGAPQGEGAGDGSETPPVAPGKGSLAPAPGVM